MEKLKQDNKQLAEQPLARYLEAGERVIWHWQPDLAQKQVQTNRTGAYVGVALCVMLELLVVFSMLSGGIDAKSFWVYSTVIVFAVLLAGYNALVPASQLPSTNYTLTTRQAIIIQTSAGGAQTTAVPLNGNTAVKLTEQPDGSGTISFGPADPYPGTGLVADSSFRDIPDVARVYQMVRQVQSRQ